MPALSPALASRVLALSAGSWQILSRLVTALPEHAAIEQIAVSLRGRGGRVRLTADDVGVAALGRVVRYPALQASLLAAARVFDFAPVDSLRDVDTVTVHAEGDTGANARELEFDQVAVIAEVLADSIEPGLALERFTEAGPLALLPLPEPNRLALVWCCRPDDARRRCALEPTEFIAELQAHLGNAVSIGARIGPATAVPLTRRIRQHGASGDEIWIGNAAQSLHPVAGQGLNLGLRDAFMLAQQLGSRHLATAAALAGFTRQRRRDRMTTIGVTDTLARIFTIEPLQPVQSIALAALELTPPARRGVARAMMFGRR